MRGFGNFAVKIIIMVVGHKIKGFTLLAFIVAISISINKTSHPIFRIKKVNPNIFK